MLSSASSWNYMGRWLCKNIVLFVLGVFRWIKFEEDVEVGGWGRPHISALAFHSLAALRKTLESGM